MGHSEGGHYYAFIRKEGDKWYQFNDTEVTPFDISLLEEETFGGDEPMTNENHLGNIINDYAEDKE